MRHKAYIGLGGNLGNVSENFDSALKQLDAFNQIQVCVVSSRYRSAPVGYADQPDFINAVAKLDTDLSSSELLTVMQEIETALHRVRSDNQFGPRTLDLDLLLFDEEMQDSDFLTLPHPRMHDRRFVLEPLVEIAPQLEIPGRGRAIDLLAAVQDQSVEKHT